MKKALIVLIPLILIGSVVGLALKGIIKIPGLTPAKKTALAAGLYGEVKEKPQEKESKKPPKAEDKKKEAPVVSAEVVPPDVEAGLKKIAGLWNSLETTNLMLITAKWKEKDLAPIFLRMEKDKVSAYLAAIKPEKASSLSLAIQREAEKPRKG